MEYAGTAKKPRTAFRRNAMEIIKIDNKTTSA